MKKLSKDTTAFLQLSEESKAAALEALVKFQLRKDRVEHPKGCFDNANRFYPSDEEDCGITAYIRSPSRSWPNSYMYACRTLNHCEDLCGASHDDVLFLKRLTKKAALEIPADYMGIPSLLSQLTVIHRNKAALVVMPENTQPRLRS